jgi:hypothetical protein
MNMNPEIVKRQMPLPVDYFWNQRKDPETAQDLHVMNVYGDSDFNADVAITFPEYLSLIGVRGFHEMPSGEIDPQAKMKLFRVVERLDDTLFTKLTEEYGITTNDIKIYLMGIHHTGKVFGKPRAYSLRRGKQGGWVATFNVDIKEQDFKKMWAQVRRNKYVANRGKLPRAKPPVYDKLLYAIFKARHSMPKPKTFREIFDLYKDQRLPHYDGPARMFKSEDKLEDYYHRHRPKP